MYSLEDEVVRLSLWSRPAADLWQTLQEMWAQRLPLLDEEVDDIVAYSPDHQKQEKADADQLGPFHDRAWPPSRAGMGSTFIKASMMLMKAVSSQKRYQLQ